VNDAAEMLRTPHSSIYRPTRGGKARCSLRCSRSFARPKTSQNERFERRDRMRGERRSHLPWRGSLGNADVARRARNREDAQTTCGGVSGATACAAATDEACAVRCPVRLGYGLFVSAGCECGLFGERLVERACGSTRVLVEIDREGFQNAGSARERSALLCPW